MDRRRAAGALLALAACVACTTAAPATSNQTALDLIDGPSEGCYYNFQHYGEGDRIMTNEPCLNCTCHNRMLMCYLRVCPFTKPIGQDCTIEKRADQCCPIVTCPDVPVDLLTSTSTSSPAEYGATGLGKVDKYGCSINGKYFSEGSKVPPSPNKPCEHCYCIRNMTTCVMQECTLHVDGCTPIYHKDVCCPVRYSCDHQEDEILLLDDMTTTVRPTPGFLLTTTTTAPLSQMSQDCVHDDQIFADGALIKTEKACEHCYCMKGDIVCVVQECGTPMENEGKNCTSLPPRVGQCCPDTYICEGDELLSAITTTATYVDVTTSSPPKRVEGSGYRNEPDEAYTEIPAFEGSGEEQATTTLETSDVFTSHSQSPEIIDEVFAATEEPFKPSLNTFEPDKGQNTVPDDSEEITQQSYMAEKTSLKPEVVTVTQSIDNIDTKETESIVTVSDFRATTEIYSAEEDELIKTTESLQIANKDDTVKIEQTKPDIESTTIPKDIEQLTTQVSNVESSSTYAISSHDEEKLTTLLIPDIILEPKLTTTEVPQDVSIYDNDNKEDHKDDASPTPENDDLSNQMTTTISRIEPSETTSVNPVENEIDEDLPPGRIPGEGDCLLNGVTYKNNTNVPNINNCHSSCKCASSIVKCDPIICSPPPEQMDNMNDCQPIYDTPDACCPTYVCHSRETIPPESHSQMAGTESPKSSPEQPETDCQGEQCESHKITPTSSEPCTVESCQAQADDQVNDCKNNDCVQTETTLDTSSAISAEGCIGEMCLPSKDSCADGHCQEPTTSEHICDSDKGCQPSGECEGGNCGTDQKLTNPEVVPPMCEDPEECKMSGVPELPVAPCSDDHECKNGTENTLEVECEEQNCRRKEQPAEENKPQTICSDSSCTTKDIVQDESSIFTTESSIKLQPPKEPSSEMIDKEYSTLPESELSPTTHDIHKVTKSEDAVTETQDISMEVTTEQSDISSSQNINEYVTVNESSSETSVQFVTKAEEEITEKPHIDDVQTITSDSYTSKSVDETTESLEIVTKETTNELPQQPLETQYEEHLTESSEKVTTGLPDKHTESQYLDSLITSTETDIKSSEKENNEDDTNKIPVEQITQKQEFSTELPNIFVTTTKQPQIVISQPELPNTDEIYTETPVVTTSLEEVIPSSTEKDKPIKNYTPDQENTISDLEVSITESSATIVDETITENHVGVETNDENMKHTGGDIAVTKSPEKLSPVQSVPFEQSTESQKTTLLDIIDKEYDDTEKDKITTEINDVLTEQTPSRTTEYEPFITNQDKETSQIIDGEKVTETKEDKVSSVQEQHETTEPSKYTKISSDEQQNTHTSTVQPLVTETQTQEISVADDTKLTESPINESPDMTADFDTKESSTQYPEISITTLQESTTKLIKTDEIPLHPSVTVEDHTGQSVLDSIDKKTTIPEEKLEDGESSSTLEPQKEEVTYVPDEPILGMETTVSSLLPDKNEEESTKLTETGISAGESSTLPPEILTTKYDDILTSISNEIERKPIGTESSSQEDNEIVITESSKPLDAETHEISGHSSVTSPDQYSDKQTTKRVSMELMTESHVGPDEISVTEGSQDENKTERTPSYTSHYLPNAQESGTQHSEKSETTLSEQFVTESIDNEVRGTDMQKPTEYPASFETETQNIQSSISITQSQDFETKLVTKLDTYEISTTPGHSIKEVQTETPLSLITEEEDPSTSSHSVPSEDVHKPEMDKTTHDYISVSNEEFTEEPESHYTELQKPSTESLITTLSDKEKTETLSQTYTEKESYPESISTTVTYPSSPFLDTNVEENPSSTDTDTTKLNVFTISENIASTTELPNKITPLIQDSSDSDLHQTIVLQETTSVPEIVASSDKSISIPEQEMETESPAISVPVTIVAYDEVHDTKHETKPSDEDTVKGATEQPLFSVDLTTTYSKPETETESAKEEDQNDISITEPTVQEGIQAVTVDYPNYSDKKQEDESDLHKPSKQDASTLTVDERATTESFIDLEQPTIGDGDQYDTKVENQEKSTESSIMLDSKKEITTPLYQDSTTSEESGISLIEEEHRRTLAPELERETDQTERSTTETLKITELPDLIITQNKEHSEVMQEMSTIMPDRESVTLVTILDIDASPQTEILPTIKDIEDPIITESKDTSTKESQEVTSTPTYVELDDGHVTEKDETMDKPTAHDLVRIPVETKPEDMPSDNSVTISTPKETSSPLESGTEISIPRETDSIVPVGTEASVSKETEMYVPVETEKDTFVPEETETTSPIKTESTAVKETDMTVSKVTEASIPKETDDRELKVSETTDTTIPKDTATDEMTKEPEKTTNRPKDDQSQEFDGSSATPEVVYSSSETTPYLVELQEHTNKIDETISTVLPIEEYTSKSPDVFQTERGDQPLDITQEEVKEHITVGTTEKLTEQPTESPTATSVKEQVTQKAETEIDLVTSESPISTPSDIKTIDEVPTLPSGELSTTISPAVSEITKVPGELTTLEYGRKPTTDKIDLLSDIEKAPEQEVMHEATIPEDELSATITKASTIKTTEDTTTQIPILHDKFTKPEDKPIDSHLPTLPPELTKPDSAVQPAEEVPSPDFPPSGTSGYGQEPDYVEEDQAFGPGTCRYGGKVYVSAQQIPRDDPCDFCFCFRSDIICLQQSCPPPIHGCHEEPIQGFCCPRYECPVSMATTLNVTTTTTTTTTTLPPHFLPHAYKGAAQRRGCQIKGHSYKVGEVVRASSGPCLHCTCGGDGQMKCDPKACTPEPMLRQMIAAAVSAKRRR